MDEISPIVKLLLQTLLTESRIMPISLDCIIKMIDTDTVRLDHDNIFQSHILSAQRASKELSSYIEYAIKHIEENS